MRQRTALSFITVFAIFVSSIFAGVPLAGADAATSIGKYGYEKTVEVGATADYMAEDVANHRLYVAKDFQGSKPAEITWLDTQTNEPATQTWPLGHENPRMMILDGDSNRLFVAHDKEQVVSILNTETGAVEHAVPIDIKYPRGMVYASKESKLYVYDSNGNFTRIDPVSGAVEATDKVGNSKYPGVKDAVYDPSGNMIWILLKEGVTAYDIYSHSWDDTIEIPVQTYDYGGELVGGTPAGLTLDADKGYLFVRYRESLSSDWSSSADKMVIINTSWFSPVGSLIRLGEGTLSTTINPKTHEFIAVSKVNNEIRLLNPDDRSVQVASFNDFGVTEDTGNPLADANIGSVLANSAGTTLYVSHPYQVQDGSRVSILREGAEPVPPPAEGEDGGDTDDDSDGSDDDSGDSTGGGGNNGGNPGSGIPGSGPKEPLDPEEIKEPEIPAQENPADTPNNAVTVENGNFSWAFNDYMQAWETEAMGSALKDKTTQQFTFTNCKGWLNKTDGSAHLTWAGGIRIQPYKGIYPELKVLYANPELTVAADGTAQLTMETYWALPLEGFSKSDGFNRVKIATFKNVAFSPEDGKVKISGTPEFFGRKYLEDGMDGAFPKEFIDYFPEIMKTWWYTTGASRDADKIPVSFDSKLTIAAETPSSEPAPTSEPALTPSSEPEPSSVPTSTPSSEPAPTSELTPTPSSEPEPSSEPTTTPTSAPKPTPTPSSEPGDQKDGTAAGKSQQADSSSDSGAAAGLFFGGFAAGLLTLLAMLPYLATTLRPIMQALNLAQR